MLISCKSANLRAASKTLLANSSFSRATSKPPSSVKEVILIPGTLRASPTLLIRSLMVAHSVTQSIVSSLALSLLISVKLSNKIAKISASRPTTSLLLARMSMIAITSLISVKSTPSYSPLTILSNPNAIACLTI